MLAWLLQRWKKWSDKNGDFAAGFPRDHILTNATIYWVNAAIGQSIRSYRNAVRYPWKPSHDRTPAIEAPAGFTFLAGDHYPPGADVHNRVEIFENGPTRHWYNPVYVKAHEKGGHFGAWEHPDAFIETKFLLAGADRQMLVIYQAEPGSRSEEALAYLAATTAQTSPRSRGDATVRSD